MQASQPFGQAVNARETDPRLKRAKPQPERVRLLAGRAACGVLVALAALLALPLQTGAQTLSTDATLRNLGLKGATGNEPIALSPVFDSDTETYTSAVANRIDAVTLTARKTDANATVAITNDGDTSTPSHGGTEPHRRVQHDDGNGDRGEQRHEDLHDHGDAGQRPTRADRLPRRHRLVHHHGRGVHERGGSLAQP